MICIQLHRVYIPFTYTTYTAYKTNYKILIKYICHIQITYKLHMLHMLHMEHIQVTYDLHTSYIWKLICTVPTYASCDLHTVYIWKKGSIKQNHKKSTKASWFSEAIFICQYFIAKCRTGLGLAGQGRSKPPTWWEMGDVSNQEATGINLQQWPGIIEIVLWDLLFVLVCKACLKHNVTSASNQWSSKETHIYMTCAGG